MQFDNISAENVNITDFKLFPTKTLMNFNLGDSENYHLYLSKNAFNLYVMTPVWASSFYRWSNNSNNFGAIELTHRPKKIARLSYMQSPERFIKRSKRSNNASFKLPKTGEEMALLFVETMKYSCGQEARDKLELCSSLVSMARDAYGIAYGNYSFYSGFETYVINNNIKTRCQNIRAIKDTRGGREKYYLKLIDVNFHEILQNTAYVKNEVIAPSISSDIPTTKLPESSSHEVLKYVERLYRTAEANDLDLDHIISVNNIEPEWMS